MISLSVDPIQTPAPVTPAPMITVSEAPSTPPPQEPVTINLPVESIAPVSPISMTPIDKPAQTNTSIFDTIMASQPSTPASDMNPEA
jgi:hypothetical protein